MCGLVGISGKLAHRDELFMKRLLILDWFRGQDSTGLAAIKADNGSTKIAKAAVNPIDLFDMKSFEKTLNGWQSSAFIGHNRAATLGKVNNTNAHPYQFGNITGAHNGTLYQETWRDLETEAGIETSTDSAAVFACINEIGIDATIAFMEKGRTPQTGAWALTYYDKESNSMCFIRNAHRPLWYAFNKDRTKLYWASETVFLDAASRMTKKQDWDGWYEDEEGYSFFPFEEDHLYEVDLQELEDGLDDKAFKAFKGRKLEGKQPAPLVKPTPPVPTKSGGATPWQKAEKGSGTTPTTSKGSTDNNNNETEGDNEVVTELKNRKPFQITTLDRTVEDPLAGLITESRFDELAYNGCTFCGADIKIGDDGYTIYDEDDTILCSCCSKQDNGNVSLYLPLAKN